MNYVNRTNIKSKGLNLCNGMNNKVSVNKTFLYCNTCGKSVQENLVLCYIFIDYFCGEKCHAQKHNIYLEKIVNVD